MKALSTRNVANALIFPVGFLIMYVIVLIPVVNHRNHIHFIFHPFGSSFILVALLGWIYFSITETFDLRYDDQYLYLKGVLKSFKIPLTSIHSVDRAIDGVRIHCLTSWKYRITLHPSFDLDPQVAYEVNGTGVVEEFIGLVKSVHPNLKTAVNP